MGKIWVISDLHLNHDRKFIYQERGFKSIEDMNCAIIKNWNNVIAPSDDIYVLGDLCLGGSDSLDKNKELIEKLNGTLHIVRGNHDTFARLEMYRGCKNVVEVENVIYLDYKNYHFYMSHYPTITSTLEKDSLEHCLLNLYGHIHEKEHFYKDMPFMYCVGCDAHDCKPILLDDIIKEMKNKCKECIAQL